MLSSVSCFFLLSRFAVAVMTVFALKMDSISTFVKATDRGGGDLDDGVLFSAGGSSCSSTPAKLLSFMMC